MQLHISGAVFSLGDNFFVLGEIFWGQNIPADDEETFPDCMFPRGVDQGARE